jgi:hypothetical protein
VLCCETQVFVRGKTVLDRGVVHKSSLDKRFFFV